MVQELKLHVSTAGGVSLIPGHGNNIPYATSLVAQMVKSLSTMQETWVQSRGQEDPLEKKMAIHSSTIAWKIPWTEEPGRLIFHGVAKTQTLLSVHSVTLSKYFLRA